MKIKSFLLHKSYKFHKIFAYIGGLALLIFALSGLLHPIMIWTSPMPKNFMPPAMNLSSDSISKVGDILSIYEISKADIVQIVPYEGRGVLQVTENSLEPRRYFSLETKEELVSFDRSYAAYLARYYTGYSKEQMTEFSFQTEFTMDYPWVNRLLPVYKVAFDTPNNRQVFVDTQLSSLAGDTTEFKRMCQSLFQIFHTFDFVNYGGSILRVVIMMIFLLALLSMAVTGSYLLFMTKKRPRVDKSRAWHRRLAYGIFLAIMMLSISGMYHLLQMDFGDNQRMQRLVSSINLTNLKDVPQENFENATHLMLLNYKGNLYYRLATSPDKPMTYDHHAKYNGMPSEGKVIYIGEEKEALTDEKLVKAYAKDFMKIDDKQIISSRLIYSFNDEYDFRNKRLPIWRVETNLPTKDILFIDVATGTLVDSTKSHQKLESMSFSLLHKWNFLVPFIGRMGRDALVVFILLSAVCSAIIGYVMLFRKRNAS